MVGWCLSTLEYGAKIRSTPNMLYSKSMFYSTSLLCHYLCWSGWFRACCGSSWVKYNRLQDITLFFFSNKLAILGIQWHSSSILANFLLLKTLSGFCKGIKPMFLWVHLALRITALTLWCEKWIPLSLGYPWSHQGLIQQSCCSEAIVRSYLSRWSH